MAPASGVRRSASSPPARSPCSYSAPHSGPLRRSATATVRAIRRCASLPIIALTAKALKYDREKALESGASAYVAKPVDADELISVMRRWIGVEDLTAAPSTGGGRP
ncbi:response regulator [Streptomyces sp. NPDC050264]|uniref:response regulator n=1 Tax=Streptomyces sp. NPDC050264 TaxID=3155038 RepID=UPI0034478902